MNVWIELVLGALGAIAIAAFVISRGKLWWVPAAVLLVAAPYVSIVRILNPDHTFKLAMLVGFMLPYLAVMYNIMVDRSPDSMQWKPRPHTTF